ncbi:hypothetical protein, partial [Bradyrhizobium sp. th.b2]|uniref:hypothetical protein n=1 Tax=Bradyrhizobium sp. th-b2 TaxID=172088 RepID=UPI001AEC619C
LLSPEAKAERERVQAKERAKRKRERDRFGRPNGRPKSNKLGVAQVVAGENASRKNASCHIIDIGSLTEISVTHLSSG